jgi:hypothetical protein
MDGETVSERESDDEARARLHLLILQDKIEEKMRRAA